MTRPAFGLLVLLGWMVLVGGPVASLALVGPGGPLDTTAEAGVAAYVSGAVLTAAGVCTHAGVTANAPSDPAVARRWALLRLSRRGAVVAVAAGVLLVAGGSVALAGTAYGVGLAIGFVGLVAAVHAVLGRSAVRVRATSPVDVPRAGDEATLTPAAVRRRSRAAIVTGLVAGTAAGAVTVVVGLGGPGWRGVVDLAGQAVALVGTLSAFAVLSGPGRAGGRRYLAATGGDRQRAERIGRAVRDGRLDRLDDEDRAAVPELARALLALVPVSATTAGVLLVAVGGMTVHQLALGKHGLVLWLAMTVVVLLSAAVLTGRRYVRRMRAVAADAARG